MKPAAKEEGRRMTKSKAAAQSSKKLERGQPLKNGNVNLKAKKAAADQKKKEAEAKKAGR